MVGQRMKPKENVSFRLKNIMPGPKKLWEEHLFPLEKLFFLPSVDFSPFGRKKQPFFLRKQKFASEFFCPWHNVSTQKEHIFLSHVQGQNFGQNFFCSNCCFFQIFYIFKNIFAQYEPKIFYFVFLLFLSTRLFYTE